MILREFGIHDTEHAHIINGHIPVKTIQGESPIKAEGKLLVIDGLSYMFDDRGRKGDADHIKYKNMCADLFRLSKQCGCAVVVMMQANRETQNSKDQKGDPFPLRIHHHPGGCGSCQQYAAQLGRRTSRRHGK